MAGKPNPWLVVLKLVGTLVATGVLGAGLLLPVVGGVGLAVDDQAKNFLNTKCTLQETQPPRQTLLYARDNKTLLARIFEQDRQPVKIDAIPKFLQQALVATEDRRFFSHHGVDIRGLIRGAVNTTSGDTQGGSTLTMQYVKQIRYYQAGNDLAKQQAAIAQNLQRKIEDAKCALELEQHESKQDILVNYLNIAFFGENSYGIETAAETYFNHTTAQLTLPEAAMLVGLLRAPTQYDPFQYPEAAFERRNEVLQNLVDVGDLTQAAANRYARTPVSLATTKPPEVREGCSNAPDLIHNVGFFCQYAVDWLLNTHTLTETQLKTGGYHIVTTLNASLQNTVQQKLASSMPASSPMTAVMPIVDPRSGDVLAMASSKQFGQTTSTRDNTHTTLPIFTAYSALGASTYKLFPLLTALSTGVPRDWPLLTPSTSTGYTTKNCVTESTAKNGDANEFYAPGSNDTLEDATAKSSNTYYLALADQLFQCDLNPMVDMASRLGMRGLLQPSDTKKQNIGQNVENLGRAQQFVLGDIPTSPLELASAYAAVANNGRYFAPAPIRRITDFTGHQVISVPRAGGVQAVAPQVAQRAVQVLEKDTTYPGTSASEFQDWYSQGGSVVASKTGTGPVVDSHGHETDQNGALWFVGMTPNLVATTALINFDRTSAPAAGLPGVSDPSHNAYGSYAAKVWLAALQSTLAKQSWTWPDPDYFPGSQVTNVIGEPVADAQAQLRDDGYKVAVLGGANSGLLCASTEPLGTVAYYGPKRATPGTTITLCGSLGRSQDVYVPPPPPTSSSKSSSGSGSSGSGSAESTPNGPGPTQTAHTGHRHGSGNGH